MTGSGSTDTTLAEGATARTTDLSPVSPENLFNPIPFYRTLRETDPVHWSPEMHGWFLTRHDDVMNSFRDTRFSANRVSIMEQQFQNLEPSMMKDFTANIKKQMLMFDGPEHIRMRRQTSPSFTPQALDSWLPVIRRTMQKLLDQVHDRGEMDFVPAIAYEFPPRVIAEFMGVPQEHHDRLLEWAAPIARFGGLTVGMDVEQAAREANTAMREFAEYLMGIAEQRRREPADDLISRMLNAQVGKGMTAEEVVANTILMLNAGHMTTTDQVSNIVHDLLSNPEQLQLLRENPKLLPSAVEESLRFRPAVPFHYRIASEDITLRGKTIRKGDIVFMGIASANRDHTVFPNPDRFDITRDSTHHKHLTFSFGPHHCLGAGLARRELELAVEEILLRLPGLRLDENKPPKHKCTSLIFRGFVSLPLRW
jgi:cytochrome P450